MYDFLNWIKLSKKGLNHGCWHEKDRLFLDDQTLIYMQEKQQNITILKIKRCLPVIFPSLLQENKISVLYYQACPTVKLSWRYWCFLSLFSDHRCAKTKSLRSKVFAVTGCETEINRKLLQSFWTSYEDRNKQEIIAIILDRLWDRNKQEIISHIWSTYKRKKHALTKHFLTIQKSYMPELSPLQKH